MQLRPKENSPISNSRLVWPALTASPRTYSNSLEKRSKLVGFMFLSITSANRQGTVRQVQRRPCRGRTSYSCSNSTGYFCDLHTLDERIVSGHLCAGRAFLFGRIDDPVPPSGMGLRSVA